MLTGTNILVSLMTHFLCHTVNHSKPHPIVLSPAAFLTTYTQAMYANVCIYCMRKTACACGIIMFNESWK